MNYSYCEHVITFTDSFRPYLLQHLRLHNGYIPGKNVVVQLKVLLTHVVLEVEDENEDHF